jgi:ketosteroid isomerase-like protein
MSEESTTSDLVELTRHALEAASRHDADALMGFYAPDAVLDLSAAGIGTFEGVATMRSFLEDWWGTWGDHLVEVEEIVDLGHDVVFSRTWEDGRLLGSDSHVEQRVGWVFLWVQGMLERQTVYLDIDEAVLPPNALPSRGGRRCRGRTWRLFDKRWTPSIAATRGSGGRLVIQKSKTSHHATGQSPNRRGVPMQSGISTSRQWSRGVKASTSTPRSPKSRKTISWHTCEASCEAS